ncbi:hypothetical protein [Actinophytocola sediminis]
MSDRLVAWVRTVVPALWAALVAWLVSLGLPPAVTDAAAGLVDVLVVPVVLAAVYAAVRWVEPRLPSWLAVVLLGSIRVPVYALPQRRQHAAEVGEAAEEQRAA